MALTLSLDVALKERSDRPQCCCCRAVGVSKPMTIKVTCQHVDNADKICEIIFAMQRTVKPRVSMKKFSKSNDALGVSAYSLRFIGLPAPSLGGRCRSGRHSLTDFMHSPRIIYPKATVAWAALVFL